MTVHRMAFDDLSSNEIMWGYNSIEVVRLGELTSLALAAIMGGAALVGRRVRPAA